MFFHFKSVLYLFYICSVLIKHILSHRKLKELHNRPIGISQKNFLGVVMTSFVRKRGLSLDEFLYCQYKGIYSSFISEIQTRLAIEPEYVNPNLGSK